MCSIETHFLSYKPLLGKNRVSSVSCFVELDTIFP